MTKTLIMEIEPYVKLYRDTKTGIAWVEDGRTGSGHSAHPNISGTGSVRGMKDLGYWRKADRAVRSHGWIYNIDRSAVSDALDYLAMKNCRCGGKHIEMPGDEKYQAELDAMQGVNNAI